MMQAFSSPSVGGNQGTTYVSSTSSSAQNHTYFMQAVSFGDNKDMENVEEVSEKESEKETEIETKMSSFLMAQPHTLNHIDLQLKDDNTATDHPSIQTIILVDSVIEGRIYAKEKSEETSSQKMEGIEEMMVGEMDKPAESTPLKKAEYIANFQQIKQKFTEVRVQNSPTLSSEQAHEEKNDTSNILNNSC